MGAGRGEDRGPVLGRERGGPEVPVLHVPAAAGAGRDDDESPHREETSPGCPEVPPGLLDPRGAPGQRQVHADNVYLVGFKTQGGEWFAFKNKANLIEGATALDFNDDYNGLTGGGNYRSLKDVVVGKRPAMEALAVLANYNKKSIPDEKIQEALTRFVLIFCEAARLVTVRAGVIAAWELEQGGEVAETALQLTVKWRIISCALIVWEKTKKTNKWEDVEEATEIKDLGNPKMTTAEAAAKNVYCILQPTDNKPCSDRKKKKPPHA
ncbi:hypothetical protein QOZ80_9BG0694460 [Eleusine coracana subsp. coracana]|nr:hypothetical protein QOZ80_9BG0694460 [Eleusine coracana subsp. coracana]